MFQLEELESQNTEQESGERERQREGDRGRQRGRESIYRNMKVSTLKKKKKKHDIYMGWSFQTISTVYGFARVLSNWPTTLYQHPQLRRRQHGERPARTGEGVALTPTPRDLRAWKTGHWKRASFRPLHARLRLIDSVLAKRPPAHTSGVNREGRIRDSRFFVLVSWCFEPSQTRRIISRLKRTLIRLSVTLRTSHPTIFHTHFLYITKGQSPVTKFS